MVKLMVVLGTLIYIVLWGMIFFKREGRLRKIGENKRLETPKGRWRARIIISCTVVFYALFINWDKVEDVLRRSSGDIKLGGVLTIGASVLLSVVMIILLYERVLKMLLRMYRDKGIINVLAFLTIILPFLMILFMDLTSRDYEKYFIAVILIGNVFLILRGINICIFNKKDFKKNDLKSQIYLIILWFIAIGINFILATVFINTIWTGAYDVPIGSRLDVVYYTVVTLTTIGYGRIAPVHDFAKISVMVYSLLNYYMLIVGVTSILSDGDG